VADKLIVAPRGAGSRFIMSLLIDYYNLPVSYWYDELNNEYHHHRSAHKTPGNTNPSMYWNVDQWVNFGSLVDEDQPAEIIKCTHQLEPAREIYYVDARMSMDWVTKLVLYKAFTRSFSEEVHSNKMLQPVNLSKWKDYLTFLKHNGVYFPPINRIFTFYFLNNEEWIWDNLRDKIRRQLQERKMELLNLFQYEDNPNSFTYENFINANTGTVLDNYSSSITTYHQRNIEFVTKFERVFGCI